MKPKDLSTPLSRGKRVFIEDRIWYVPEEAQDFPYEFPGWSHPDFFGNEQQVCIEYCSGNGAWIAAKALANPSVNWVALEMKFGRVKKIWSKIKNLKLNNLIAICGEGYQVTKQYFSREGISQIYINFPDPWPKRRHAKHRLLQTEFVNEIQRVLKKEGVLAFVTDDHAYSEWTIKLMQNHRGFEFVYPHPFYLNEWADYGTSYFEKLWRDKGKMIRYHLFRKT